VEPHQSDAAPRASNPVSFSFRRLSRSRWIAPSASSSRIKPL